MKDDLGKRMKTYESVPRHFLMRRNPVIIRLDGKAFHTFTKGMKKPFDEILIETMQETAKYLCQNIQGCKIAYTQSDEISLLLTDYENSNTYAWFDNNIQKMASISASMATLAFNKHFSQLVERYIHCLEDCNNKEDVKLAKTYQDKLNTAMFDSRVFSLPKEEVVNYFIWRQKDAIRNSVQMVGHANFSHKELHRISCPGIIEKLEVERNLIFDELATHLKRGTCIIKENYYLDNDEKTMRTRWIADLNIPEFVEDREYISRYV